MAFYTLHHSQLFPNRARTATYTCISHRNDIPDMFWASVLLQDSVWGYFWEPVQNRHLILNLLENQPGNVYYFALL